MFPVGIGLRDPRSQKRDLGHPSISPFDIAEGTSFVISLPTRLNESAARDDKGKGDLLLKVVFEPQNASVQQPPFPCNDPLLFVIPSEADSLRRVGREMTKLVPSQYRRAKSKGAPGLAFETWDPSSRFLLETPSLLFVIPSSRLAEASRERNDKAGALCNIEG